MTRDRVTYEWVWELMDGEEILDCGYYPTYREAKSDAPDGVVEFALCRRVGNDDDGEIEREYAYVDGNGLPERFDAGSVVPKRFHAEVARRSR